MITINNRISVVNKDDTIFWFQGSIPVFRHHVNDESLFRSFCCQLINLGNATSADISRALNINHEKLSRWARLEKTSNNSDIQSNSVKKRKNKKKHCLNP